jgi:hypothetical protein
MCIGSRRPAVDSGLRVTCGSGTEDAVEPVCTLPELVDDIVCVLMQGAAKFFQTRTFVVFSLFDGGDSPIAGRLNFAFYATSRIGVVRFGSMCSRRDLSSTLKSIFWGSSSGLLSSSWELTALTCSLLLARASNSSARLAKLPYDGRCSNGSEGASGARSARCCSVLSGAVLVSPSSGGGCSSWPSAWPSVTNSRCPGDFRADVDVSLGLRSSVVSVEDAGAFWSVSMASRRLSARDGAPGSPGRSGGALRSGLGFPASGLLSGSAAPLRSIPTRSGRFSFCGFLALLVAFDDEHPLAFDRHDQTLVSQRLDLGAQRVDELPVDRDAESALIFISLMMTQT